jgi:hypothetical protein
MASSVVKDVDRSAFLTGKLLNPAELKIDLLCCGLRVDASCRIEEEGRPVCNAQADLASGLEMILPGDMFELWVNVPVREKFVQNSPYRLSCVHGEYRICDERHDWTYSVSLAPKPGWYDFRTKNSVPMSQVGMLQGSLLSIGLGEQCRFWSGESALSCRFCRRAEPQPARAHQQRIEDVVETVAMAREKSGITFALLRGGYQGANGLAAIFPYLTALKQKVGILVGLQFPPETDLGLYDQAQALGVDHLSFCLDFYNREYFHRFAPGKSKAIGQECFFRALEYCVQRMRKGTVSGEIIAGVEPIEDSLRGIDYLVGVGAIPLVSIFRPLQQTEMQDFPPPRAAEMVRVFRHVYQACRAHNLPIGLAPNIHLSVLPPPEDTIYLAADSLDGRTYQHWILSMKQVMRPYFFRRMRKQPDPEP